jgi:PTH1 family peptidyl-tRNA hydrolase
MSFKALEKLLHRSPGAAGVRKIIVGLGNPGPEYSRSRHNAGFMAVNRLAKDIGASFDKKEGLARTAHGSIEAVPVLLARPQTYMNLSGRAVTGLLNKYRLKQEDLIIIHDDMDLRPGQIRVRNGGSSGGHRGVESVICELQGEDFVRVRIGVGRPETENKSEKRGAVVDFVLDDFNGDEGRVMAETMPKVIEAVKVIVIEGLEAAMNRFNGTPKKQAENLPGGGKE